ncbi:MAG TPA: dienelactone hydrolase family protein [Bacteroidetes bacterium]|nr:dienelactone hydrolase family protein [Bacteroidota bacterium]
MTNKLLFPLCLLAVFLFVKCSDPAPKEKKEDRMAQFTDDEKFKGAHEQPADIAFKGKGTMVEFATPDGTPAKAYLLKADPPSNQYLFVFHEWWGLNDQIKRESERLFSELGQVNVLAPDLYDGNVTDEADEAGRIMKATRPERCEAIINGALALAGDNAKVATIGWCFGGGWSLRAGILAAGKGAGCVMYYGMPVERADEIAPLQADILGIFAKKDDWINEEVIGKFEALAKATGKHLETHWFDAAHAFANPSSPRYNEAAAQEANALALAFLKQHLAE